MSEHHDQAAARVTGGPTGADGPPGDGREPPALDALDALVERFIDLAVYAPVGVAVTLRDELPRHVKQGRQALENRIQLARFIGQLAVQTGQRELQKRIEQQREARQAASIADGAAGSAASADSPAGTPADSPADTAGDDASATAVDTVADSRSEGSDTAAGVPARSDLEASLAASVPAAAELPISDYESLPAINVVDRLRSMSPDEIELVRRFEQAHRARRTILAKIDQLQERHASE
jgi:hypothetical protein